jgi:hypothetical protein
MIKTVGTGVTLLFITASSLAYAQAPSARESLGAREATPARERELGRLSATDVDMLADARASIVKSALQLTPDQEKLWPAIDDAIHARAKNRQARLENVESQAAELRSCAHRVIATTDSD